MTSTDYIKNQLSELKDRVEKYAKLPNHNKSVFTSSKSTLKNLKLPKSILFYASPPVIIMVVLFFMKPDFVCDYIDIDDDIDMDDNITKKLNYAKVLITGLVVGGIISIALFAYFKKKKNNK